MWLYGLKLNRTLEREISSGTDARRCGRFIGNFSCSAGESEIGKERERYWISPLARIHAERSESEEYVGRSQTLVSSCHVQRTRRAN